MSDPGSNHARESAGPRPGHPVANPLQTMVRRSADVLLVLLAILAGISLIADYGFYLSPALASASEVATTVVLYGLLAHLIARLYATPGHWGYTRTHRVEVLIAALIVLHLALPGVFESAVRLFIPALPAPDVTRLYVALSQLFVSIALIPPAMRYGARMASSAVQPASLIALSFLATIMIGGALLMLPRATHGAGLSSLDAFFTAASAVCVTGLTVVDTASTFTFTGHLILLGLIQIGGLGIMTLTTFFAFMSGGGGSLKQFSTMKELLAEESLGRIRSVVLQIGGVTLLVEAAGACILYLSQDATHPGATGIFPSVFHAVSAFCNAGFIIVDPAAGSHMLAEGTVVPVTIMALVIAGGLGFPVLISLARSVHMVLGGAAPHRITVHTRLVLITTALLLAGGTVVFFLLERTGAFAGMSADRQVLSAMFYAVTARTAGFATTALASFSIPAILVMLALMWIGASPGSTGGGIKTTTIAVAFVAIRSLVTGRTSAEVFRHRLPERTLMQAFSTIALSLAVIGIALFCLVLVEEHPFVDLLFEVVSALGTVGLSMGITPALSPTGKVIVMALIFIGRVGVLAMVLALSRRSPTRRHTFTEEAVHIT